LIVVAGMIHDSTTELAAGATPRAATKELVRNVRESTDTARHLRAMLESGVRQ
jgi:hypothetical protein